MVRVKETSIMQCRGRGAPAEAESEINGVNTEDLGRAGFPEHCWHGDFRG